MTAKLEHNVRPVQTSLWHALFSIIERRPALWAILLVAIASARIIATYSVFNNVMDEPPHIACGMEWLDQRVYQWEPQHPPLARVAAALPLYLSGIRSQNTPRDLPYAMSLEGSTILYSGHEYGRHLALARFGTLPFFWAACAVVYLWGTRFFRAAVAVMAVFLFSLLPPVLAHAGLATTDMAVTATFSAAFLSFLIWLEEPSLFRGVCFGAALGLMTLSKFTGLAFFATSAALALAWHRYGRRADPARSSGAPALSLAFALLTCAFVVWAGYRFSFGDAGFFHLHLPAPELYAGIRQVLEHNAIGHRSYLLGSTSQTGFWWFFPVALAVKSPLPFLILVSTAVVTMVRKNSHSGNAWSLLAFSLGVLLVGVFSRINIGIRHILPVYVGLSLLGGIALVRLMEWSDTRKWLPAAIAMIMLWFTGSSVLSHPDYLAYFNEFAGSAPERILVDSDLDWGQDLKRLGDRLHQLGATDIALNPFLPGNVEEELGFPRIHPFNLSAPTPGWNAIGVTAWKKTAGTEWLDRTTPRERVGKSILLWYFAPLAPAQVSLSPALTAISGSQP